MDITSSSVHEDPLCQSHSALDSTYTIVNDTVMIQEASDNVTDEDLSSDDD